MNVWIFVISALFTPIVGPLGRAMDMTAPTPSPTAPAAAVAITTPVEPSAEPRYHGIERMFAKLESNAP
jgi:hypothetical protein